MARRCSSDASLQMLLFSLLAVAVLLPAKTTGRYCEWNREGSEYTCPDNIITNPSSSAEYTRCCVLEAPWYLDTFVIGLNFGTPACCVERRPGQSASSTPMPGRQAELRGPDLIVRTTAPRSTEARDTVPLLVTKSGGSSGLETEAIIGIAITAVAGLIIVCIVIYVIISVSRKNKNKPLAPVNSGTNIHADGQQSPYARRKSRTNLVCFTSTEI